MSSGAEQLTQKSTFHKGRFFQAVGTWIGSLEDGDRKTYWISFVVLWLIMFGTLAFPLISHGQGFIWFDDGLTQQYTTFIQEGEFIRDAFAALISGAEIPLWTQTAGYGYDLFLSLAFIIGNPINLISVFSTPQNADTLLNATVPITLALTALSASYYGFYHRFNGYRVLVGSMVFTFSGCVMLAFNQIPMLYQMVLAPLIFLGVDKIFDRKSPALFIVAMALQALYSIQGTYEACLLLFIYCLVRFWKLDEKKPLLSFLIWFGKILGCVVLGIAIAAVLFLPPAASIFSQERIGLERTETLFYEMNYYYRIFTGLLSYNYAGSECFVGFSPIVLVCACALLFTAKSRQRTILVALVCISVLILLLPFAGKVFDGFAYPNNRWVWAFSLLGGYLVMAAPSKKEVDTKGRRIVFTVIVAAYFIFCFCLSTLVFFLAGHEARSFVPLLFFCVLSFLYFRNKENNLIFKGTTVISLVMCCAIVFSLTLFPLEGKSNVHVGLEKAYEEAVENSPNALIDDIEGTDWSYDVLGSALVWRNSSIAIGKNGVSFYNSTYNNDIDIYHTTLGLCSAPYSHTYTSFDGRVVMEQLAGVRYLIAKPSEEDGAVPPLYRNLIKTEDVGTNKYALYESSVQLPLAFLYPVTVNSASLQDFSELDHEYAMLDAASINDPALPNAQKPSRYAADLPFSLSSNGILKTKEGMTENSLDPSLVGKDGATIHLDTTVPANTQVFVTLRNVSTEAVSPLDYSTEEELAALSLPTKAMKVGVSAFTAKNQMFSLDVSCGNTSYQVKEFNSTSSLYGGKNSWVVNLGSSTEVRQGIDIHLADPGWYAIESIQVNTEDTPAVEQALSSLAANGAKDILFNGNTVECAATATEDLSTLFFRLPYSTGWSATVDGQPANLEKTNTAFMALRLDEGEHQVQLHYRTPLLTESFAISTAGLVVFGAVLLIYRKRHP